MCRLNTRQKHTRLRYRNCDFGDETGMDEGIGGMRVLQPKGVIHSRLLEKQEIAEEKIKELEQKNPTWSGELRTPRAPPGRC